MGKEPTRTLLSCVHREPSADLIGAGRAILRTLRLRNSCAFAESQPSTKWLERFNRCGGSPLHRIVKCLERAGGSAIMWISANLIVLRSPLGLTFSRCRLLTL